MREDIYPGEKLDDKPIDMNDVYRLIRDIQRRAGQPSCFAQTEAYCDKMECRWRYWCLDNDEIALKKTG